MFTPPASNTVPSAVTAGSAEYTTSGVFGMLKVMVVSLLPAFRLACGRRVGGMVLIDSIIVGVVRSVRIDSLIVDGISAIQCSSSISL